MFVESYHVPPSAQGSYWEALECAEFGSGFWSWNAWVQISAMAGSSYVTLLANVSMLQFSYLVKWR